MIGNGMNKKLRYSLIILVVATIFGSFFLSSLNNKKQVNRTFTYSEAVSYTHLIWFFMMKTMIQVEGQKSNLLRFSKI